MAAAEKIGYPVLIKASAGGGGKGIRLVERAEDMERAFETASSEGGKGLRRRPDVHGKILKPRQAH